MAGRTSQVLIKYTVVKVHSNCVSLIQDKVQNVYRIFRPWYHQWKEKGAVLPKGREQPGQLWTQ